MSRMSRTFRNASLATLFTALAACAHHRDVRPGEGGLNSVDLKVEDKGDGYRDAMDQAEHYCDKREERPIIVSEDTQYVGSMDEQSYKTGRTVAKVAQVAGGAGYIFGGESERRAGGVVGLGGLVGDAALGQGYRYSMKFRCK